MSHHHSIPYHVLSQHTSRPTNKRPRSHHALTSSHHHIISNYNTPAALSEATSITPLCCRLIPTRAPGYIRAHTRDTHTRHTNTQQTRQRQIQIHTHTHTHTHGMLSVCVCARACLCASCARMCACARVRACLCACVCARACVRACARVRVGVCTRAATTRRMHPRTQSLSSTRAAGGAQREAEGEQGRDRSGAGSRRRRPIADSPLGTRRRRTGAPGASSRRR